MVRLPAACHCKPLSIKPVSPLSLFRSVKPRRRLWFLPPASTRRNSSSPRLTSGSIIQKRNELPAPAPARMLQLPPRLPTLAALARHAARDLRHHGVEARLVLARIDELHVVPARAAAGE